MHFRRALETARPWHYHCAVASSSTSLDAKPAQFPPTLWTIVLAAGERSSPQGERALTSLCETYWYPLYAFLRKQGRSPHDAEDLTQAFFVHLLSRQGLRHVDPRKGRFRSFLLASLKNFVADEWAKTSAQKRGGGAVILSLDADLAEERYQSDAAQEAIDPERLFEQRWAWAILDRVLARLETEFAQMGKAERFEQLRIFLSGDPPGVSYAQIADRLKMTEGAVKVAVLRLRQRYRELFRAEVAQTVAPEELDDEMRRIISILAQ
jgi:RNA polymerase sigma-70 factor (ECF subfamily)